MIHGILVIIGGKGYTWFITMSLKQWQVYNDDKTL